MLGAASLALLLVENDPSCSHPQAVARDLQARITYYDAGGKERFSRLEGGWADIQTELPVSVSLPVIYRGPLDLRPGEKRYLAIALKYFQNNPATCFILNHESNQYDDRLNYDRCIPGARVKIKVELNGGWIHETRCFILQHMEEDAGGELHLEPSAC